MLKRVFDLSRRNSEGTVIWLTQSLNHAEGAVYSETSYTFKRP